jgi:hypothetical protein
MHSYIHICEYRKIAIPVPTCPTSFFAALQPFGGFAMGRMTGRIALPHAISHAEVAHTDADRRIFFVHEVGQTEVSCSSCFPTEVGSRYDSLNQSQTAAADATESRAQCAFGAAVETTEATIERKNGRFLRDAETLRS